jgi:hypothetical protein
MTSTKKRASVNREEDNRVNRSPDDMLKVAKKATRRESNRLDKVVDELRLVEKKVSAAKTTVR